MHFSGFDFGPETLGLSLSIAEDIAAEENQHQQMLNEKDIYDEEETLDESLDFECEEIPAYKQTSKKPLRPFEQYVEDFCRDRKIIEEEPDYGHVCRRQVRPNPLFWLGSVKVFQNHLVSNRFLKVSGDILRCYPENRIMSISFSAEGYPRRNGQQVFAVYLRQKGAVVINLLRHLENGTRIALIKDSGFSIRALFWYSMLHSLLHELYHSLRLEPYGEETAEEQQREEVQADQWCDNEIRQLAQSINIEPPPISEEPFFNACFNDLMKRELNEGNYDFVKKQKMLLDANLMYWNENSHVAIETMAALCGKTLMQETSNFHDAMVKESLFMADRQLKDALNEQVEVENALKEACEKGYRLKIDYHSGDGRQTKGRIILPQSVYVHDGLTYVEALCEMFKQNRRFRIDHIKAIEFLV